MTLNDPLANVLSHILNAERRGAREITTMSANKIIKQVLEIFQRAGYLGSADESVDNKGNYLTINLLGQINKIGVIKPRYQIKKNAYERYEKRYLPARDFGVIIVSTTQGLMTHTQAKEKGLGGKLLCYCY